MATSLAPNPLTYVHPPGLTMRSEWYGDNTYHRMHVYKNATSLVDGNPWVVFRHPGSWLFFDKTGQFESPTNNPPHLILAAWLLDNTYGNVAPPFTLFSFSTRQIRHSSIGGYVPAQPYEPTIGNGAFPRPGVISRPAFGRAYVDDAQRVVQHIKDNATLYGIDPERGNAWGSSAGASATGAAALSATRAYSASGLVPNLPMHDSYVRSWINWIGPIDFRPSYMDIGITAPLFGLIDTFGSATQLAQAQALLQRAGSTDPSPLCTSISPRHLAPLADLKARKTRILSVYDKNNAAGSNPFTDPHDWRQSADQKAACGPLGISYQELLPHLVTDFGGDRQLMWESTLVPTYAHLVASNA